MNSHSLLNRLVCKACANKLYIFRQCTDIVYIYKCPLKQVRLYTDIILLLNAIYLKFYRNSDRNLGFDNLILRKSG